MKNLQDSMNEAVLMIKCKMIMGIHFVGIREYENSKGEISNQTFNMGINFTNVLKKDLATLNAFDISTIIAKFKDADFIAKIVARQPHLEDKLKDDTLVLETIEKGYSELVNSLIKRTASEVEKAILRESGDATINRSDAQIDAFTHIAKGLKTKEDNLYVYGFCVRKTVLKKGVYPIAKSQLKTIIKNEITKSAELKASKYKSFKLGAMETVKIQGVEV